MVQPVREPQYQSDQKFNLNRLLSEPFATKLDIGLVTHTLVAPEEYERFPDVSFYQGVIDFAIMASKAKGVIVRAGQGKWVDNKFRHNYTQAKVQGMKCGIYWFYDDRVSPQEQLRTFLTAMEGLGIPEMEIWVDWENTYGGQHSRLRDVVAFMQLLEQNFPLCVIGMYTGYYWFVEHSNPISNYSQFQYLKQRPLWLAWYGDITSVKIPAPWKWLRHWQYGTPSIGLAMGVETKEIDMNMLLDPEYTWEELYGKDEPPLPPTTRMEVLISWQ